LYFAVYEVERCYGGPEEGGWWYDRGRVLGYVKLRRSQVHNLPPKHARQRWTPYPLMVKASAMRGLERLAARDFGYLPVKPKGYRGRGSVIGGPDIEVRVMPHKPEDYPDQTPHYE
jgi:hypothetical protein